MKLTDFKTKSAWTIGILAIISIWIAFPLIFKYWVFKLLVTPPFTTENFSSLGPIGDIYGSLTALFTSATLIVVLYSAYLQREANKDAREAMAEQLKQAKESTTDQLIQAKKAIDDQLTQAREATKQQLDHAKALSDIQLNHAKNVAIKQHDLMQLTHDTQIKESKYAMFSNVFNSLINQKHSKYLSIQTIKDENYYTPQEIFSHLNRRLVTHITKNWKDIACISKQDVERDYYKTMHEICNTVNYSELFSYFKCINDIYELINRFQLEEEDKLFFKKVLLNSMTTGENAALFWIGVFRVDLSVISDEEIIFGLGYNEFMMPFAVKFYKKECFNNVQIHENWDRFAENQNPT